MLAIGFHKLTREPKSMQNIVSTRECILLPKDWVKLDFKNISGLYIQIPFCSLLCKYPISNLMVSSVESHSVTANFMNRSTSSMHWSFFFHILMHVFHGTNLHYQYEITSLQLKPFTEILTLISLPHPWIWKKKQTKHHPQFPVPCKRT